MIFLTECFEDLTTYDKFSILSWTTGDQYLDFPQNWQAGNPDQTWMKQVQKKGDKTQFYSFSHQNYLVVKGASRSVLVLLCCTLPASYTLC
jgi:hypothetical protein